MLPIPRTRSGSWCIICNPPPSLPMPKAWTKTISHMGVDVRLYERGGAIWRAVKLGRVTSENGRAYTQTDRRSLKHSDRALAERQAKALAESIAEARLTGRDSGKLTLGQLFATYRLHKLADLSEVRQREVRSKMAMFTEAWGRDLDLADLDQSKVDTYCRLRRTLAVVSPGMKAAADGTRRRGYRTPKPVRDGALDADFRWLASVVNWATRKRLNGTLVLASSPLHGLTWPKEANKRRPVASHERYTRTMDHVDAVDPAGRLRTILVLARYTGRRESALCALQASDLLLSRPRVAAALAEAGMDERLAEHMPHGAIRWRAASDKMGLLFISPISAPAREALDLYLRQSARVGDVPLFPAPKLRKVEDADGVREEEVSIGRETVMKWLVRAEKLAELPKLKGGVFHPYRRLWATERKHMPDVDVAAAGGWKDTQALRLSYQHADAATVLRVVEAS